MALRVDVFTVFPSLVEPWFGTGVVGRAARAGLVDLRAVDIRCGASDARGTVDDSPFGGGAGMVLAAPPVFAAVESTRPPRPLLLLGPAGRRFDQEMASELAQMDGFSLLCGRYEGVDERLARHLADGEVSIGDFVLAGGEAAAVAIVEAVVRLVRGALGNEASVEEESFRDDLLEYPQYTRPAVFRGWSVPDVLLSGDHGRIRRWRHAQSLVRTLERRPDLMARRGGPSRDEVRLLREHVYPVGVPEAVSDSRSPAAHEEHAQDEPDRSD